MKQGDDIMKIKTDALSAEYQGDYGTARSDFDVSDLLNNPLAHGINSILSLGFPEKLLYFPLSEFSMLGNDATDSFLIAQDAI